MLISAEVILLCWLTLFVLLVGVLLLAASRSGSWRVRPSRPVVAHTTQIRHCDSATVARNMNTIRARNRALAQDGQSPSGHRLNSADSLNQS